MDVGGDGLGVVGGFVSAKEVGTRVEVDDFRRLFDGVFCIVAAVGAVKADFASDNWAGDAEAIIATVAVGGGTDVGAAAVGAGFDSPPARSQASTRLTLGSI